MKLPKVSEIQAWVFALPIVKQLIDWSKTHSLPGFFSVPLYDVLVFIINELKHYALVTRANSMAFSFFLSLFPSLISLLTLFPYFEKYILYYLPAGQNFDTIFFTLEQQFSEIIPGEVFQTVKDVATTPRFGLLSFGFFLAIFFASNGMLAMMKGFEKSYNTTFRQRSALEKRGIAISLTFLVGFLVLASVVLVILGRMLFGQFLTYINADGFTATVFFLIRWLAVLLFFYFGISLIYRYGAATHQKFRIFSPGAMLATVLTILSSVGFSFYVEYFDTYNKLYGSIGTIIVVMLWIQINCFILLVGFELNASIAVNRDLKIEKAED